MKIEAVILAAGFSSRASGFKMELDFFGKSILQRNIESMYDLCTRIIVVGGYEIDRVRRLVGAYDKVELVCNTEYEKGMFSSVKKGCAVVAGDRFLFTPGDYPLLTKNVCEALIQTDGKVVVPTFQGRKGHPIVLDRCLVPAILEEPEESNLKLFLRGQETAYLEVEDKGILIDVDTPEDYACASSYYIKQRTTKPPKAAG